MNEVRCPSCKEKFAVNANFAGPYITCPSCKFDFPTPPPMPPAASASPGFDEVSQVFRKAATVVATPRTDRLAKDTWGVLGVIAASTAWGFIVFSSLLFTPYAPPIAMGGIAAGLFSESKSLRGLGIAANALVIVVYVLIAIYHSRDPMPGFRV
jgi:hypothetical protein